MKNETIDAPKKRGPKPRPNSARNGGERIVGIVSPDEAETIRRACHTSGLTRGELLVLGAHHLLGMTEATAPKKGKST